MSTRLRVSMTFAVVTMEGGVIREQTYSTVAPTITTADAERLAGICHNTVTEELPKFLTNKGTH